jgi:hypothetical protein
MIVKTLEPKKFERVHSLYSRGDVAVSISGLATGRCLRCGSEGFRGSNELHA